MCVSISFIHLSNCRFALLLNSCRRHSFDYALRITHYALIYCALELSRNVQSRNTQNLKQTDIRQPEWRSRSKFLASQVGIRLH